MKKIICPKCKSSKISGIPSSTLPIFDDKRTFIDGSKVPDDIMKKHLAIKHICSECLYEL